MHTQRGCYTLATSCRRDDFIKTAADALYDARRSGRNNVRTNQSPWFYSAEAITIKNEVIKINFNAVD